MVLASRAYKLRVVDERMSENHAVGRGQQLAYARVSRAERLCLVVYGRLVVKLDVAGLLAPQTKTVLGIDEYHVLFPDLAVLARHDVAELAQVRSVAAFGIEK